MYMGVQYLYSSKPEQQVVLVTLLDEFAPKRTYISRIALDLAYQPTPDLDAVRWYLPDGDVYTCGVVLCMYRDCARVCSRIGMAGG